MFGWIKRRRNLKLLKKTIAKFIEGGATVEKLKSFFYITDNQKGNQLTVTQTLYDFKVNIWVESVHIVEIHINKKDMIPILRAVHPKSRWLEAEEEDRAVKTKKKRGLSWLKT